ncbi:hypothetical protein BN871_AC_00080 [Paenibacillus sp. P22]|nr:hypothetical protein BN871_AC_00080 [Paenibacillus sp. P22]
MDQVEAGVFGKVEFEEADETLEIKDKHGQHGSELDDDLEHRGPFADEIEQLGGQNHVAGRRYGYELRQAFNNAQYDCFDIIQNIRSPNFLCMATAGSARLGLPPPPSVTRFDGRKHDIDQIVHVLLVFQHDAAGRDHASGHDLEGNFPVGKLRANGFQIQLLFVARHGQPHPHLHILQLAFRQHGADAGHGIAVDRILHSPYRSLGHVLSMQIRSHAELDEHYLPHEFSPPNRFRSLSDVRMTPPACLERMDIPEAYGAAASLPGDVVFLRRGGRLALSGRVAALRNGSPALLRADYFHHFLKLRRMDELDGRNSALELEEVSFQDGYVTAVVTGEMQRFAEVGQQSLDLDSAKLEAEREILLLLHENGRSGEYLLRRPSFQQLALVRRGPDLDRLFLFLAQMALIILPLFLHVLLHHFEHLLAHHLGKRTLIADELQEILEISRMRGLVKLDLPGIHHPLLRHMRVEDRFHAARADGHLHGGDQASLVRNAGYFRFEVAFQDEQERLVEQLGQRRLNRDERAAPDCRSIHVDADKLVGYAVEPLGILGAAQPLQQIVVGIAVQLVPRLDAEASDLGRHGFRSGVALRLALDDPGEFADEEVLERTVLVIFSVHRLEMLEPLAAVRALPVRLDDEEAQKLHIKFHGLRAAPSRCIGLSY